MDELWIKLWNLAGFSSTVHTLDPHPMRDVHTYVYRGSQNMMNIMQKMHFMDAGLVKRAVAVWRCDNQLVISRCWHKLLYLNVFAGTVIHKLLTHLILALNIKIGSRSITHWRIHIINTMSDDGLVTQGICSHVVVCTTFPWCTRFVFLGG